MDFPERQLELLNKRNKNDSFRTLKVIEGLIDFSSNDYLGLSQRNNFIGSIGQDAKRIGSTGSRLLTGNSNQAMETESYLANLLKSESALIFNSGYAANLAVISSVPQRNDTIIYDELSHASIKDGIRLSFANKLSFKHNDLPDLDKKLVLSRGEKFVVVESAYSMDGDLCPLKGLIKICKKHNAYIILDEAHCTGVYGSNGGGLSEEIGIEDDIFCRIYTFGKAMGYHGAAVLGSQNLINYLINYARPFIYTTALPDASYNLIKKLFEIIPQISDQRIKLKSNIEVYNNLFNKHLIEKYNRVLSNHPIQTIIIPGNDKVKGLSEKLRHMGFDVRPILSPTVKEGSERLRICLHSFNSTNEISKLVHSLADL